MLTFYFKDKIQLFEGLLEKVKLVSRKAIKAPQTDTLLNG